jgi:hypothetical protein
MQEEKAKNLPGRFFLLSIRVTVGGPATLARIVTQQAQTNQHGPGLSAIDLRGKPQR